MNQIRAHLWNSWQKNATQNPDFLPRAFNVEEMRKDVGLMQMLQPILMVVNQLLEGTFRD